MTDRELLESAAKAAGKIITGWNSQHGGAEVAVLADGSFWQPLHDNHLTDCMGDALRLAVALRIDVDFGADNSVGAWSHDCCTESLAADPAAATRRAITRAAAALSGDAGGGR